MIVAHAVRHGRAVAKIDDRAASLAGTGVAGTSAPTYVGAMSRKATANSEEYR
jgi:hypothetical protein